MTNTAEIWGFEPKQQTYFTLNVLILLPFTTLQILLTEAYITGYQPFYKIYTLPSTPTKIIPLRYFYTMTAHLCTHIHPH